MYHKLIIAGLSLVVSVFINIFQPIRMNDNITLLSGGRFARNADSVSIESVYLLAPTELKLLPL